MKKILTIINSMLMALAISLVACLGPEGPVGPPGYDGLQGEPGLNGTEGFTIEYGPLDFTSTNDYTAILDFEDVGALESDVILAFMLWSDIDGEDIWRLLPQTILTPEGLIQYNYDFTRYDATVFINTEFNSSLLLPEETDGKYVRVVIVPAQFFDATGRIDLSNYDALMNKLGLSKEPMLYKPTK